MNKTVAFLFGRMSPPTIGHGKVIEALASVPADDHRVYLSHSFDNKKNPLPYHKKLEYAREFFKDMGVVFIDSESKTIMQVMQELNRDFNQAILVVGGDRVEDFDKLLNTYNNKPDKAGNIVYSFDFIDVVSAGERDPDADDVTGMSASKLRAYAAENDFDNFLLGVPTKDVELAKQLFNDVRANLSHIQE